MEINNVANLSAEIASENIKSMYAVKCVLMARQTDQVVGSLLQDTVEISKEAMDKFLSEIENK